MGLVALIAAVETAAEGGALRATLPLGGVTLIEHQARRAARAGAGRVVVIAEERPSALVSALARLAADGLAVALADGITAAADLVHPHERVLLVADGCLADQATLDRVAAATQAPAVLAIPDSAGGDMYERIDGTTRWAGLALIEGRELAATAAMLGDWDPVSTLLRRAVQAGATRIASVEDMAPPAFADDPAVAAALERRMVAGSRGRARDWPARLYQPLVERWALPWLLKRRVEPHLLAAGGAVAGLSGGIVALIGWRWPALALLLLSAPAMAAAERLALVRAAVVRRGAAMERARLAGAALALGGLAGLLAEEGAWGWWLIAGGLIAVMAALVVERRIAAAHVGRAEPAWLASPDALAWTLPPFAVLGLWGAGLAVLLGYAGLSFAIVQRRLAKG